MTTSGVLRLPTGTVLVYSHVGGPDCAGAQRQPLPETTQSLVVEAGRREPKAMDGPFNPWGTSALDPSSWIS